MKTILLAMCMFGFSIALAQSSVCFDFYGKKTQSNGQIPEQTQAKEKIFEVKKIELNKKGEVAGIDVTVTGEIKAGESAIKISDILKQIGRDPLASDLTINMNSDIVLKGRGEFFGVEFDIQLENSKTNFVVNLKQNIEKISSGQTFVSVLTESKDTTRLVVNLSGEVKKMGKTGKYEQQRCKG